MRIQVLGTGCPKCKKLAENVEAAARSLGMTVQVEKVTEMDEIVKSGVMMTPALAVDGEVKSVGRVLQVEEVVRILKEVSTS
ncbi:MAG: thioredoxin family protein [Bacteroidota bacterium]